MKVRRNKANPQKTTKFNNLYMENKKKEIIVVYIVMYI